MSDIFNRVRARKVTSIVKPRFADTITDRIISAGWLLSEMDLAGGDRSYQYADGRTVTVGIEAMEFKAPVYIGEEVRIYTEALKQGKSSLMLKVEAFATPREGGDSRKVTEGIFTFVHIDEEGKPKALAHKAFQKKSAPDQKAKNAQGSASETQSSPVEPELRDGQVLSMRTVARPKDMNFNGDIFGGWLLEKMDEAGFLRARNFCGKTVVPRALDAMTFHKPVSVLDEVSFYTEIEYLGNSSVRIKVECWALRNDLDKYEKVTEGSFTYVAVDKERKAVPITPQI